MKFLEPHLLYSAELKERFLIEERAAAILSHPNICVVHEVASTGEAPSGAGCQPSTGPPRSRPMATRLWRLILEISSPMTMISRTVIARPTEFNRLATLVRRSSVTAILGARQVGKTTLALQFAETADTPFHRFDLENPTDLARLADPMIGLGGLQTKSSAALTCSRSSACLRTAPRPRRGSSCSGALHLT